MELSAGLKPTVHKPAGGRVKSFGGRTKGTKGGWLVRRERSGMGRWGWPSHGGTGLVPPQRTETLDTRESLSFVQFNKNTQCETFPCFWGFIGGHPVPPSPCPCPIAPPAPFSQVPVGIRGRSGGSSVSPPPAEPPPALQLCRPPHPEGSSWLE